jgi:hypothetical protein
MRLYKIITQFIGKDLDKGTLLGYVVVENDDAVYDHINTKYKYSDWPSSVKMTREGIVAAKGDFGSEYMGEFYDQKFGWEDLGEISTEDISHLRRLKVIAE